MKKTTAGRVFYQAILKHVLNPDVVDADILACISMCKGEAQAIARLALSR